MKLNAKHFFLEFSYLILFYFLMWNFVFLVFTLIDSIFFKGSRDLFFLLEGSFFKFNLASLLVVTPVFFALVWFLRKNLKKDVQMREGRLRKWSIYITLFLSGLIVIVDLITLVHSYLSGSEITKAFLMKSAFALILFSVVFGYFVQDLRGYWDKHEKRRKAVLHPFITIVVISIVISLFAIGNPRNQKMLSYDLDKMRDLSAFEGNIKGYYQDTGKLPDNIMEVKKASPFYTTLRDPQTGKEYSYNKIDDKTFELCAEFNFDFPEIDTKNLSSSQSPWMVEDILNLKDKWNHTRGENCFKLDVRDSGFKYPKPVPIY